MREKQSYTTKTVLLVHLHLFNYRWSLLHQDAMSAVWTAYSSVLRFDLNLSLTANAFVNHENPRPEISASLLLFACSPNRASDSLAYRSLRHVSSARKDGAAFRAHPYAGALSRNRFSATSWASMSFMHDSFYISYSLANLTSISGAKTAC